MSNGTARIRPIAFATAVFRCIVTANASGFTRKHCRQGGPDYGSDAAGLRMLRVVLKYRAPQLNVSRELLRRDNGSFYLAGVLLVFAGGEL